MGVAALIGLGSAGIIYNNAKDNSNGTGNVSSVSNVKYGACVSDNEQLKTDLNNCQTSLASAPKSSDYAACTKDRDECQTSLADAPSQNDYDDCVADRDSYITQNEELQSKVDATFGSRIATNIDNKDELRKIVNEYVSRENGVGCYVALNTNTCDAALTDLFTAMTVPGQYDQELKTKFVQNAQGLCENINPKYTSVAFCEKE